MRLISGTGTEGPPVSSLKCDRSLYSGIEYLVVKSAGCQITDRT